MSTEEMVGLGHKLVTFGQQLDTLFDNTEALQACDLFRSPGLTECKLLYDKMLKEEMVGYPQVFQNRFKNTFDYLELLIRTHPEEHIASVSRGDSRCRRLKGRLGHPT